MPDKLVNKKDDKVAAKKLIVKGSKLADNLAKAQIGTPEFKSTVRLLIDNLKQLQLHADEKM